MDSFSFSKTLHYIVDCFIFGIQKQLTSKMCKNKIFYEILKRKKFVIQNLRSLAVYGNTISESDNSNIQEILKMKVDSLINKVLFQDFIEFAYNENVEMWNIFESDLHNFLYLHAAKDETDFTSSFNMGMHLNMNFSWPLLTTKDRISSACNNNNSSTLNILSAFKNAEVEFQDNVSEIKKILENGFSSSDMNPFNIASLSKCENKSFPAEKENLQILHSKVDYATDESQLVAVETAFDNVLSEMNSEDEGHLLSWENCLGKYFSEHQYVSELSNVEPACCFEKQNPIFLLKHSSETILEKDMVLDILDLLIGIPSHTFLYDFVIKKFKIRTGIHLPSLSAQCTAEVVKPFVESGSMFYLLQKFIENTVAKGLIFQGFQFGIQKVLSSYKEYIASIKAQSPTLLYLRSDVIEIAELLYTFGRICGIIPESMEFIDIPKGLGILSYLHNISWCHKKKEDSVMIAVLLKHTYTPYLSFLNKWMTEGTCDDPFGEFQIMEDYKYLGRRDALYWKFAYTEHINDPMRTVPPEIKEYSQGILDCGKSIGLLKICCPELCSLKYLSVKPPPSLTMVFSFPAIIQKLNESMKYIERMEMYERRVKDIAEDSIDGPCIRNQKHIKRDNVLNLVQRRWNILLFSEFTGRNLFDLRHLKKHTFPFPLRNLSTCKTRFKSMQNVFVKEETDCDIKFNVDNNFSGKLVNSVGLLFSSCGYKTGCIDDNETLLFENMFYNTRKNIEFLSQLSTAKNALASKDKEAILSCELDKYETLKKIYVETECHYSAFGVSHSFIEKLAFHLVSGPEDSIEDVYSCLNITSLQHLMMHHFNAAFKTRIHLVEKTIVKYIVNQLGLDSLLFNLHKLYFFQDDCFIQSLCEQLFALVMKCKIPGEFANWTALNEILLNAIYESNNENNQFYSSVNVNVAFPSDEMAMKRTDFLKLFFLEVAVDWPLNIIIHNACIQQYSKIFSTLLQMEFLCWLLGRIWKRLMIDAKNLHLDESKSFRDIMLNRFDMDHFIRIVRNSINEYLQGPLLEFLRKNLAVEESSIDTLEQIHIQYLEQASARCFLTEETHVLHELLNVILCQIYKFCSAIIECSWELNAKTGLREASTLFELSAVYDTYKQYKTEFLKLWLRNIAILHRNSKGDIDEKVWAILGQRIRGISGSHLDI